MKQSIWTIILVAILALYGLFNGISLLGFEPSPGIAAAVFGLYFFVTLAVVAWMQTRWGALLVVVMGIFVVISELISAALVLFPQYGDQTGQLLYALSNLIIPLFGFLSYRSVKE